VDDVLEVSTYASLPGTGETGKIYVTLDTNYEYRWSGSTYIRLVASPGSTDAVAEGSTNLYFTATRVLAVVMNGLSTATNAAVVATDTMLAAIGKLQAQITAVTTSLASKANKSGDTLTNVTITGYIETEQNLGVGSAFTINPALGTYIRLTTNANTTITLPAPVGARSFSIEVLFGGAHTITFTGGGTIRPAGGALPTPTSVNGKKDLYGVTQNGSSETLIRSGGQGF
jgi:hypothetical protein